MKDPLSGVRNPGFVDPLRPGSSSPFPARPAAAPPPSGPVDGYVAGEVALVEARPPVAAVKAFPSSWEGSWSGPMTVWSPDGGSSQTSMSLRVGSDGEWTLQYEGQPPRPYRLVPVDPGKGHYLVDERNGIQIDAYLRGDTLYSQFDVQDSRVTALYRRTEEGLEVEMHTFGRAPGRSSGAGDVRVDAFALRAAQKAVLTRR